MYREWFSLATLGSDGWRIDFIKICFWSSATSFEGTTYDSIASDEAVYSVVAWVFILNMFVGYCLEEALLHLNRNIMVLVEEVFWAQHMDTSN